MTTTSHFGLLVLFALFVALTFAVLMRDDPREQLTFGAKLLAAFVGIGVALGWLMYQLPL
jgi:heme A synthase